MDLHSDSPFWLMKNGMLNNYPSLQTNKHIDIVILGAGITGAFMGYYLNKAGFEVMLFDKRHAATGSTCASTALLQYEIDQPLTKLISRYGEKKALRSYRLCIEALEDIGRISKDIQHQSLEQKSSFQYASFKKDISSLYPEYLVRKKNNFPVEWLSEKQIKDDFHLSSQGGILSGIGAQTDPYLLTQDLLQYLLKNKSEVFDATEVKEIIHHRNRIELITDLGQTISARRLVIACGYESQNYLPRKVGRLRSTYAIISEPSATENFWYENSMIWETADPYLYLRTTKDNRIIIGGKDDDFSNPFRRSARQHEKSIALLHAFQKLMPSVPFKTDLSWSGVFSTSKDGLPFIGSVPERKNTFFALGFGGNGIVFSVVAAKIITDLIKGKKNKDAAIFSFNR